MDDAIDLDDSINLEETRSQRLQEFNLIAKALLSRDDRSVLYKVLKDYRLRHDVNRLVHGLRIVFQTNRKIELLKYVRYFLDEPHILEFDRMTNFHSKFRPRRQRRRKRSRLHDEKTKRKRDRLSVSNASTATSSRSHKDVRVFSLHRDPDEPSLGFSVRGGSEHGLGLYISEIDAGSVAEQSGLSVGDKLLEVNNISVQGAASSSAVKVLTGSSHLKLVIQRTHKVPEWRLSREKTSWFDVHDRKLVAGDFEECGLTHFIRGLDVDVPERRVNLKYSRADKTLGFNIRGGKEYGLGVYISKVDRNGLAEKNGVRVGDQIIDVNGVPFDNISHVHAVEILKDKKHLILTLRDVGRFPAYKELYAEYTWSSGQVRTATSLTRLTDMQVRPSHQLNARSVSSTDLFTSRKHSGIQPDIFLPAEQSNRLKVEDDVKSDDSDSLLDFERLANEIHNGGEDNAGYESDTEFHPAVIVHVQDSEKKKDPNIYITKRTLSENSHSSDLNEYDHADQIQNVSSKSDSAERIQSKASRVEQLQSNLSRHDSVELLQNKPTRRDSVELLQNKPSRRDSVEQLLTKPSRSDSLEQIQNKPSRRDSSTPDLLYAKIEKTTERTQATMPVGVKQTERKMIDDSTDSDSSAGGKSAEYNLATHVKTKFYSKPNKSSLHTRRESVHKLETGDDIADYVYKKQFRHNDSETEVRQPLKVEGALYSQIRRLSAASLSHTSLISQSQDNLPQSKSPESIHNEMPIQTKKMSLSRNSLSHSQESLERSKSAENLNNDVTLQIRKPDRIFSDNFEVHKDTRTNLEQNSGENIDNPYDLFADNTSEIVSEDNSDPNFSMHDISERINDLENRKMVLGFQELNTLDGTNTYEMESGRDKKSTDHKNTKWTKFKDKVKGSLRMKSAKRNSIKTTDDNPAISTRKKGLFEKSFGGHITHQNTIDGYNMAVLEDAARQMLDSEECDAVIRHIKSYHKDHGLEPLIEKLIAILDKPEKLLLLRDVRGVIYPMDLEKFENMVNKYEVEAYEKLSVKLHLPLNHDKNRKPRRHLITTELAPGTSDEEIIVVESTELGEGEKGHFRLKPYGNDQGHDDGVRIIKDNESETNFQVSAQRRGSRGANAVRSITDQFGYLDRETSEPGDIIGMMGEMVSLSSNEDNNAGVAIVHLSKTKKNLGLTLREQSRPDGSKRLLVESIEPGSAADDDSVLQAGMALLTVDGNIMSGCTVDEAVAVISKSYDDKQHVSMKLELLPKEETTTM